MTLDLSPAEIIAQIIGILALCLTIYCYQLNNPKKILVIQIVCSALFIVNLALLGALSGALLNVHGIARALVFYQKGRHKWAESSAWVWIFSALAVGCVLVNYSSPLDLLAMTGQVLSTIALSQEDGKRFRRIMVFSPPLWGTYHFAAGVQPNIGGVCNEIFGLTSLLVAMVRYDRKKGDVPADRPADCP